MEPLPPLATETSSFREEEVGTSGGGAEVIRIAKGTARRVIVIGPLAFKFARRGQDDGEKGRRCNLGEAIRYQEESKANQRILCPVVACSPRGFLIVQRAARPMTDAEFAAVVEQDAFPAWDYTPGTKGAPFEWKQSDWGYFQGRLVAVDYSSHELWPDDPKK